MMPGEEVGTPEMLKSSKSGDSRFAPLRCPNRAENVPNENVKMSVLMSVSFALDRVVF